MRRDPRLINIYDKPLHRRPLVARRTSASFGYGTAILTCVAIVVTTGAFFWLYDAVAHSGTTFAPPTHTAAHARTDVLRVPPAVPAPDMNAPEVLRAEADVPPQPALAAAASATPDNKNPVVVANARKKRTPRAVKYLPPQAREAFAAGPVFYGRRFGGGF
jgi:hypothetical protein